MSSAPSSADAESPTPRRIEFDDPHAGLGGLQEAEVTRVRTLRGAWRWALIVGHRGHHPALHQPAILVAVLYRIHPAQHRIFLSADRADAAVHVPDLSRAPRPLAARSHPLVRHPAVRADVRLLHLLMLNVRKAAEAGLGIRRRAEQRHRRRPRDVVRADGGAAPHRRLEPAAERAAVHRLSAVR